MNISSGQQKNPYSFKDTCSGKYHSKNHQNLKKFKSGKKKLRSTFSDQTGIKLEIRKQNFFFGKSQIFKIKQHTSE